MFQSNALRGLLLFTLTTSIVKAEIIIDDEIDGQVVGRTIFDAPDIDGRVFIEGVQNVKLGDFVLVEIKSCDDHDLYGDYLGHRIGLR